jgi:hypothetical protein
MFDVFFVHDANCTVIRELLDGLKKVGFKLNSGIHGSGFGLLFTTRAGGFYLGKEFAKAVDIPEGSLIFGVETPERASLSQTARSS